MAPKRKYAPIIHGKSPTKFINLPTEIIVQILRMVSANDILNLSKVSRLLYNISTAFAWNQLYTPKNIRHVTTTFKFKNISFCECDIKLSDLLFLQNVETIFLSVHDYKNSYKNSYDYDDDSVSKIFSHLSSIGCKNIVFHEFHDAVIMSKFFLPEINYYYYYNIEDIFLFLTHLRWFGLTRCEIYNKNIHYDIFKNFDDYSKIVSFYSVSKLSHEFKKLSNISDDIFYGSSIRSKQIVAHTALTDTFTFDAEIYNMQNLPDNDKKCISRYEKSVIKQKNNYEKKKLKMQQNTSKRNISKRNINKRNK